MPTGHDISFPPGDSFALTDCIAFQGPELEPWKCAVLEVGGGVVTRLDLTEPCNELSNGGLVVVPSFCNAHTHMGDSCLPDGATGMTLEEGFFRPNGYKYRQLAKVGRDDHIDHIAAHLRYMAQTGTTAHIDFREQGPYGTGLLREASKRTGVDSVILGQFDSVPFDVDELTANALPFRGEHFAELKAILEAADGFSESTMNDLTDPAWSTIRELTQGTPKIRAIHCLENEGYRNESLRITGRGDLERAYDVYDPHLIVHLTVANDDEIALLAKNTATIAINPRANANLGLPLPPIAKLLDSGVNILLGTDNGLLNSPSMLAEMDFIYKVAKSQYGDAVRPDPRAILKMATVNAGRFLGERFGGVVERGERADLTILDFHRPHLRASRHLAASVVTRVTPEDVIATCVAGKPVYRRSDSA